jgi:hypothetical protein
MDGSNGIEKYAQLPARLRRFGFIVNGLEMFWLQGVWPRGLRNFLNIATIKITLKLMILILVEGVLHASDDLPNFTSACFGHF